MQTLFDSDYQAEPEPQVERSEEAKLLRLLLLLLVGGGLVYLAYWYMSPHTVVCNHAGVCADLGVSK